MSHSFEAFHAFRNPVGNFGPPPGHAVPTESHYAPQRGVAIVGSLGAGCSRLIDLCQHEGIYFRIFPTSKALAHYTGAHLLKLAIVVAAEVNESDGSDLDVLLRAGTHRTVLLGPDLDSAAFPAALDAGFDEVWPEATGLPTLKALLKKSWQASTRLSEPTGQQVPSLGAVVLHPESCSCTVQGRVAYLSRSCFVVLQTLTAQYPQPVTRTGLFTALGKVVPGLDARSRAVDMAVYRLRKQLSNADVHNLEVRTIEHVGYGLTLTQYALQ